MLYRHRNWAFAVHLRVVFDLWWVMHRDITRSRKVGSACLPTQRLRFLDSLSGLFVSCLVSFDAWSPYSAYRCPLCHVLDLFWLLWDHPQFIDRLRLILISDPTWEKPFVDLVSDLLRGFLETCLRLYLVVAHRLKSQVECFCLLSFRSFFDIRWVTIDVSIC